MRMLDCLESCGDITVVFAGLDEKTVQAPKSEVYTLTVANAVSQLSHGSVKGSRM